MTSFNAQVLRDLPDEQVYLYHIHKEGFGLDTGYIGVTVSPKDRWSRHMSKTSDSNPILKRAIKKYDVKFTILGVFDSIDDALWQEYVLRPFDGIGWNITKGGGLPPKNGGWNKGKSASLEQKKKMSDSRVGRFSGKNHPRAKQANIYDARTHDMIAEGVVIGEWAKDNGYHHAHLNATANKKLKQHKGIYARYT